MRLDKYLTLASLGMRKEVQQYIKEGKVSVNDEIIRVPETEILEEKDCIMVFGNEVKLVKRQYYMFHKPAGCITARTDSEKLTVLDYFKDVNSKALFPVGRLDKDTEGLLFLTNDGEFDHKLMNPDYHVDKTYFFWALGSLDEKNIKALEEGLSIGKEEAITKPATIRIDKTGTYTELKGEIFSPIIDKIKMNPYGQPVVSGYLTISEGRKHQVKRMLKAVGCYVIYLKRESIGDVCLDFKLKKGEYRKLSNEEVAVLLEV
ncbi:MAG: pseudouridine synthase [bacterium]|nr:pseudouridine synthase [bacterium]